MQRAHWPGRRTNVAGVGNVTLTGTWVPPAHNVPGDTGHLSDDLGRPLVQNGRIVLDANHARRPVQIQLLSKGLNRDSDFTVSSTLSYNAFGELSEERDERVAERARALLGRELTSDELAAARTSYRYHTLGKLITRTEE